MNISNRFSKFIKLGLSVSLFGQTLFAAPAAYITSGKGFFDQPEVTVDGKVYTQGFWGNFDLKEAMKSNPEAVKQIESHQLNNTAGICVVIGGVVGGILIMGSSRNLDGTYWAGFGTLFAGVFVGGYLIRVAQASLYDAINSYNGVSQKSASKSRLLDRVDFGLAPIREGAVASLGIKF